MKIVQRVQIKEFAYNSCSVLYTEHFNMLVGFSGVWWRRWWRWWQWFCPRNALCLFASAEELRYCSHCKDIGERATCQGGGEKERDKRERVVRRMRDAGQRCSRDTYLFRVRFSSSLVVPRPHHHPHRPLLSDIVAANCLPIKYRRLALVGRDFAAFLPHIR